MGVYQGGLRTPSAESVGVGAPSPPSQHPPSERDHHPDRAMKEHASLRSRLKSWWRMPSVPRKAYLLLFSPDKGEPHEYVQILEQQRCGNQERYIDHLQHTHADVQPYSLENLRKGSAVLINAHLQVDGFAANVVS